MKSYFQSVYQLIIFGLLFILAPLLASYGEGDEADEKAQEPPLLEEVIVKGKTPISKPGKLTLSGSDLKHVPGTGGDMIRALQSLPGIGVANDFNGLLYIRGGAAEDNVFYYDRTFLLYPYHFGGIVSTLNSELIKKVDVYAGGFGAEFGIDSQAVIDIESRDGRRDRMGGKVNINLPLLTEAMVEGPVGSSGSWYLAGRRSYIDLLMEFFSIEVKQLTAVPRFWDYQAKLSYDFDSNRRITAQAFGASDFMEIRLGRETVARDPDLAGDFHFRNRFSAQSLTWEEKISPNLHGFLTLSHTPYLFDVKVGSGKNFLRLKPDFYSLRSDLKYSFNPRHQIETGLAAAGGIVGVKSFFPRPPAEGEHNYSFSVRPKVEADTRDRYALLEWYLQHKYAPIRPLTLVLGGRADYFNRTDKISFEPRASLSWRFFEDSEARLAWGKYLQTPQPYQLSLPWGNPQLSDAEATHYVFEVHRRFGAKTDAKFALYYKDLSKLVTPDLVKIYLNQGEGFARGSELFIRYQPSDRLLGWVSYAYSISKRRDSHGVSERLYSFDQTHVVSLVASYFVRPSFEVGFKWHYSTGTPYTPVIGAEENLEDYLGARYNPQFGPINSKRLDPFHRLDLRISKRMNFKDKKVDVYLEVLNAYNRKNLLALDYSEDYEREKRLHQLPIIPIFGVSIEF